MKSPKNPSRLRLFPRDSSLGLLLFIWLIFLTSCSSAPPKVESQHASNFDFKSLHRWSWASESGVLQTPSATKTNDRIRLEELVSERIEQNLSHRGYTQDKTNPDFLVTWSFGEWALQRQNQNKRVYGSAGLWFPGMHGTNLPQSSDGRAVPPVLNPYSSEYEEAKIQIVVLERQSKKTIWSGVITDDADFGYFSDSQKDRIGKAVDEIMSGFPPTP